MNGREKLRTSSIAAAIFLLFLTVLSVISICGSKMKYRILGENAASFLYKNLSASYDLTPVRNISGAFPLSCALFRAGKKSGKLAEKEEFVVILRVQSEFGPFMALFLCSENEAEFVGFLDAPKAVKQAIYTKKHDLTLEFWKKRSMDLIENYLKKRKKNEKSRF